MPPVERYYSVLVKDLEIRAKLLGSNPSYATDEL